MNGHCVNLNLFIAWTWILAGFVSGALLGLRFARDKWLGGYGSFCRRMYRLGHISFFGLGFVNLAFFFTMNTLRVSSIQVLNTASWMFLVGAVSMPVCCWIMAHRPEAKPAVLFAVPVGSLLVGAVSTLWLVLRT